MCLVASLCVALATVSSHRMENRAVGCGLLAMLGIFFVAACFLAPVQFRVRSLHDSWSWK